MITNNDLSQVNLSTTKKDFYQIWNELLETSGKISKRWDPASTNESDPGIVLLKVLTAVADKLNYNVDKNILEAFMPSAAQVESMRKLCDMMGYTMKYYNSATTNITLVYTNRTEAGALPEDGLQIPRFSVITNTENDITYFTTQSRILYENNKSTSIPCMQGEVVQCETENDNIIGLAQLDDNNRFYLPETQIAENGIFIFSVNNGYLAEDWTKVDNLNTYSVNNKIYKFGYSSKHGLPYLEFPSDIVNLIQDGLEIWYTRTHGANGNISARTLNKLEKPSVWDSLSKSYNIEDFRLYNPSAAFNGSDLESIDDAYSNYKKTIGTFDTLVTCRDYMNSIYSLIDDSNNPYVSNVIVSDIRSDINHAVPICAFDDSGMYCYHKPLTHSEDDKIVNDLNSFDLFLYPFQAVKNLNTESEYSKSFTYTNNRVPEIKKRIEAKKTIAHTFQLPFSDDIVCIKNYLALNAKITTTYKVNPTEESAIIDNIKSKIFAKFNLRHIDFGEDIPFDSILECIETADERIKNVSLEEPTLYIRFLDASGKEYDTAATATEAVLNLMTANERANYDNAESEEAKATIIQNRIKRAKEIYNKLAIRNILAGRIEMFNYNTDFEYGLDEKRIDGYEAVYPTTGKLETISTACEIPIDNISENDGIKLSANEIVEFRAPSLITEVTYPAYVNYYLHLDPLDNRRYRKYGTPARFIPLSQLLATIGPDGGSETWKSWIIKKDSNFSEQLLNQSTLPSAARIARLSELLATGNENLSLYGIPYHPITFETTGANPYKIRYEPEYITDLSGHWEDTETYKVDPIEIYKQLGPYVGVRDTLAAVADEKAGLLGPNPRCAINISRTTSTEKYIGHDTDSAYRHNHHFYKFYKITSTSDIHVFSNGYLVDVTNSNNAHQSFVSEEARAAEITRMNNYKGHYVAFDSSDSTGNVPSREATRHWTDFFYVPKLFDSAVETTILPENGLSPVTSESSGIVKEGYIGGSHTMNGLGVNSVSTLDTTIPQNVDYELGPNEYLFINYLPATSDETATVVEQNLYYDAGTIIRPNFEMYDSEDSLASARTERGSGKKYTVVDLAENSPKFSSSFVLTFGTAEQVEIRRPNKVELDQTNTLLYWVLNNEVISDTSIATKKTFDWQQVDGKYRYILQENEYVFYTDQDKLDFAYYGAGCELTATANAKDKLVRDVDESEISADDIMVAGAEIIPWIRCDFDTTDKLEIQEYQYITLAEDDILYRLKLDKPEQNAVLTNTWTHTVENQESSEILSIIDQTSRVLKDITLQTLVGSYTKYSLGGTTQTLPQIISNKYSWEARSMLELNLGPKQTQTLYHDYDIVTIKETGKPDVIIKSNSAANPAYTVSLKANYLTQASTDKLDLSNVADELNYKIRVFEKTDALDNTTAFGDSWRQVILSNDTSDTSVAHGLVLDVNIPENTFGLLALYGTPADAEYIDTAENSIVVFSTPFANTSSPDETAVPATLSIYNNFNAGKQRDVWWDFETTTSNKFTRYSIANKAPYNTIFTDFTSNNTYHQDYQTNNNSINIIKIHKSCRLYITVNKLGTSSTPEENPAKYKLIFSGLDVINKAETDTQDKAAQWTGINNDLLRYFSTTADVTDEAQLRNDIRAIDPAHKFYYNCIIDNSTALDINRSLTRDNENLSTPTVWLDANNVNAGFVVSEISATDLANGLAITRTSKI